MELNAAEARRILDDVHPEEKFILNDGTELSNLKDLHLALKCMETNVFNHHVNGHRHDFASWIHHSVKDHHLAEKVKEAKTHDEVQTVVRGRLFQLGKELRDEWFRKRFAKWEILDFALGILVGVGVALIAILF